MTNFGAKTSNDYFRQLLAAGIGNEKMFYAKVPGIRKPDDIFSAGKALQQGECGFSYLPGFSSHSNAPILIAPLIPGTDQVDKSAMNGKLVVLQIDGTPGTAEVDNEGHLMFFGKRLLDPTNPIWEGRKPLIAWPDVASPKPKSFWRSIF